MSIHQKMKTSVWKKAAIYTTAACIALGSTSAVHAQKSRFFRQLEAKRSKKQPGTVCPDGAQKTKGR